MSERLPSYFIPHGGGHGPCTSYVLDMPRQIGSTPRAVRVNSGHPDESIRPNIWKSAPYAHICHPREDFLIPLMVALGATLNNAASCMHHEANVFCGATTSSSKLDCATASQPPS